MNPAPSPRSPIGSSRRVVVKLGTRVLTHDDGSLALARLFAVVEAVAQARRAGQDVLLVSSGAVGLGRRALGLKGEVIDLADRQACAAVGQSHLMALYQQGFGELGLVAAQVLLTQSDFDDRGRYLNLRSTLGALLRRGVVPVLNENDAVATEELAFVEGAERPVFGDNDRLSALVATKLDADLLVLLTDVDGLFDRDPRRHADAAVVSSLTVAEAESRLPSLGGAAAGGAGRGGMRSKLEAALIAARSGCHAVIASGREPGGLARLLAGEAVGTWVEAESGLPARSRWIAWASAPRGVLVLDPGAVAALRERGASLLAVGVREVEGDFVAGDVVELRDDRGGRVGRGLVSRDTAATRAWVQGRAPEGVRNHDALVHRDHLVLNGVPPEADL